MNLISILRLSLGRNRAWYAAVLTPGHSFWIIFVISSTSATVATKMMHEPTIFSLASSLMAFRTIARWVDLFVPLGFGITLRAMLDRSKDPLKVRVFRIPSLVMMSSSTVDIAVAVTAITVTLGITRRMIPSSPYYKTKVIKGLHERSYSSRWRQVDRHKKELIVEQNSEI